MEKSKYNEQKEKATLMRYVAAFDRFITLRGVREEASKDLAIKIIVGIWIVSWVILALTWQV